MTTNRRQILTGAAAMALGAMAPLAPAPGGADDPPGPGKNVLGF